MKTIPGVKISSQAAGLTMRELLGAVVLLGAGLAIVVSLCLIALTGRLNRDAGLIVNAVESVRLGKSIERLMSLHHRTADTGVRADIDGEIRQLIQQASRFLASGEEQTYFEEARRRVVAYLAAGPDGRMQLEVASAGIVRLVDLNVAHAAEVHLRIQRNNLLANSLGAVATGIVLLGAAAIVLLLRRAAFRPIGAIHDAMLRFSAGDTAVRAPVHGFRELAEIAGVFNQLADSLDERRQRQLAFLAGVAHDLRNPLGAMGLALEGLRHRADEPEKFGRTIDLLSRQVKGLDRMLMDFVDASRIEAGEVQLAFERCDVRVLVREACSLFSAMSQRHQIGCDLPQEVVEVDCDSLRMTQVLTNLVSNAIKYSPEGGRIRVGVSQTGPGVRLTVSDEGVGIAAGEQVHLFEPFRRANRRTDIPGTGLGLFVVQHLIQAHRGRIEVQSQEGVGSTFSVLLPLARPTGCQRRQEAASIHPT